MQLHKAVHANPSLANFYVRQPRFDLHPHLISSVHALAGSGKVIHAGDHLLSLIVQPQPYGSGIEGWLRLLVDHIPACKIALLMC